MILLLILLPALAVGFAVQQDPVPAVVHTIPRPSVRADRLSPISIISSNLIQSPFLLASETSIFQVPDKQLKQFKSDTVVRILDANTIKLEKSGLVSLAGAQTPSIGGFPDCTATSPSKQLRKSLPKNANVGVKILRDGSESANVVRALILRDDMLVNAEVVQAGFAKPVARGRAAAEELLPGFTEELNRLNQQAKSERIGLYQICLEETSPSTTASTTTTASVSSSSSTFPLNLDDQFEPIEITTQTQWTSDGGKTILVEKSSSDSIIPSNPGDSKGCSDFETYEDALRWFETYQPYYGDVANLDRDGDGVPCPKLPHTKNMERYRRKVPTGQQGGREVLN